MQNKEDRVTGAQKGAQKLSANRLKQVWHEGFLMPFSLCGKFGDSFFVLAA